MANTNTDLTEEDAADLQFPKEDDQTTNSILASFSSNNSTCSDLLENLHCANCSFELNSPYIQCDECNEYICCACFAKGAEFSTHKNNHNYRILTNNFLLFPNSDWTAKEELTLLDSLATYGNWNSVAKQLPNRSLNEIIEHYNYFYLQGRGDEHIPRFPDRDEAAFITPVVPYRFKLSDCAEPPRYLSNTIGYQSLAGYNPVRADFENEYDMNAEDLLAELQEISVKDPQYNILTRLQCGILNAYNRRLKERERWKQIIRDCGLISLRKVTFWLHRYDMTIGKNAYEKLIRFMQICDPVKFEMLMEGLHRVGELKLHIARLIQFRRKGLTTLEEARYYVHLDEIHEENKKQLKAFRAKPYLNWKNAKNSNSFGILPKLNKRRVGFAPIQVLGMPGYDKLTESERELCSSIRLVPITYLELKELLIAENNKLGHIKLQTARRMLKIDVNKTRKLYDFLVTEGYITKST